MAFLAGPSRRHDPGGPATYRHLLSPQAMTVLSVGLPYLLKSHAKASNPLRVVAHCDIDAAYAQFEQVRLGYPDSVPLICAQWQSIIAVNYPARKFGIKRFNTIDEAKKMCPELIVQHVATYRNGEAEAGYWGEVDPRTHKVSLDPYRRESLKILAIFKEMIPKGEIEKASIDEAFLDLSLMVNERMLQQFPYLAAVPPDAPDGLDSPLPPPPPIDWTKAGQVFPVGGEGNEGPMEEEQHEEERSEDGQSDGGHGAKGSRDEVSWEDWALCIGAEIMAETRNAVWTKLHYTCSAGIAHNKPMAKLCSAWKKPNNQTVMRTAAIPAFLRNMDFTDIRFLGGKLGNAMATEYGAKTVGDMLLVPLEEMQSRFGEESIWVYNILRGIDHTEVTARVATKSMLASKNVRPSVTTPEQGVHWLNVLGGELNVRLRDAREIAPGLWPKTLVLSHRTGIEPSRSRQIPFPFTRNLNTEYIVKYARKLWDEATQPMNKGNMKLNNIALSFTGLERLEEGQKGIESFFGAKSVGASGEGGVKRGRSSSPVTPGTPGTPNTPATSVSSATPLGPSPKKPRLPTLHTGKRKTGLETFLAKSGESSKGQGASTGRAGSAPPVKEEVTDLTDGPDIVEVVQAAVVAPPLTATENDVQDAQGSSWTCPRCSASFAAPDHMMPDSAAAYVTAQRQEHDDWHFAMDLQDGDRPGPSDARSATSTSTSNRPKVKKKKAEGIKAFFAPKSK